MNIVIDFPQIPSDNPLIAGWWFFKNIGWIFLVILFILAVIHGWKDYIHNQYRKGRKYILLAIDIPKNNEQTPKAVENIFNQLAGAHQPIDLYAKLWSGEIPDSFSFEIVSIGGYIQFIIHIVDVYRDLIEAMIYAQYPDAEITEVEDYAKRWNIKFPNSEYKLWGTELILKKSQFYPLRTYEEFEDKAAKESYKDSMAALLEAMGRIGPGEEIWVQIVATPADNDWWEGSERVINKIIGAKVESKKNVFDHLFNGVNSIVSAATSSSEGDKKNNNKKDDQPNKILYLTSGQKDVVAAIEKKTGKLGFHTRIHLIYFAEKDKYKNKIPQAVYGGFKQFNTYDLNSLKPRTSSMTGGLVIFKNLRGSWRRNRIMYRYKNRGHWLEPGNYGKVLNSEEMATLYHFPILTVKAPAVKKTEIKKSEPPISLPIEQNSILTIREKKEMALMADKAVPPSNLPTLEEPAEEFKE